MAQTTADTSASAPQAGRTRLPIHPPLAHVSIGAYVTAAACDTISITRIADADGQSLYKAATYALMIATAALFLAVASGFVDRSANTSAGGRGRKRANLHALIMSTLGLVAIIDIVFRREMANNASAMHTPPVAYALTLAVLVLLVAGGRLGGVLVYQLGTGTSLRRRQ
jgi:uncharacterized membrane protein